MIYYFTGNGNSGYIAHRLAGYLHEKIERIKDSTQLQLPIGKSGIGIVFPVYAWGVAPPVTDFINSWSEEYITRLKADKVPIWAVMTCGDEAGACVEMLKEILKRRGLSLTAAWSVIMPNTYVILPGFNVDSPELAQKKLTDSLNRVKEIGEKIQKLNWEIDVLRGSWPRIKTHIVYPLFRRWGINPKKWHKELDCNRCGRCVRVCPVANIQMGASGPVWNENCKSCMACYHCCPKHSVSYGEITKGKGQYRIDDYQH